MSFRFPRNYWEASRTLHYRLTQSLPIHDDLTLRFTRIGVAVYYRNRPIITWHEGGGRMTVNAMTHDGETNQTLVNHVQRFLPRGYRAKYNGAGRMLLHTPTGRTTVGNRQRINLVLAEAFAVRGRR